MVTLIPRNPRRVRPPTTAHNPHAYTDLVPPKMNFESVKAEQSDPAHKQCTICSEFYPNCTIGPFALVR